MLTMNFCTSTGATFSGPYQLYTMNAREGPCSNLTYDLQPTKAAAHRRPLAVNFAATSSSGGREGEHVRCGV
jgi:hypothetical protein